MFHTNSEMGEYEDPIEKTDMSDESLVTNPYAEQLLNEHTQPLQMYLHYAAVQREFEETGDEEDLDKLYEIQERQMNEEPCSNLNEEKLTSQREFRRANMYAVFFLITTDILGPSNAPYAVAQMGYVPGTILYVLFYIFAAIGGAILNYCFHQLDSNNYPIHTFSDMAGRCVGPWFRYPMAGLQFIQLIMNVGLILLSTAQGVAQILLTERGSIHFCFTANILVWAIAGLLIGQIKSLSNFSHIANSAVFMNVAIVIITMVGVGIDSTPNYELFWASYGCVWPYNTKKVIKNLFAGGTLSDKISGMNNMVFAWGGATMFCEVMAELRRPLDFWKGMLMAQTFILVVYLFFALFVYSYMGQWSYVTANQSISQKSLQTAGNVISVVSGLLAAVMYGNVGLKVAYQGFLERSFNFPKLTTNKGALWWGICSVFYWGIAYILGTSIPGISALTTILGAFCIFQFSYTLPFVFVLCLMLRVDAGKNDEFDLHSGIVTRHDSWRDMSRWYRALMYGGWKRTGIKCAAMILALAALANAGLCAYNAVENAISLYADTSAAAFSCVSSGVVSTGKQCDLKD